jgi:hypothetical protein
MSRPKYRTKKAGSGLITSWAVRNPPKMRVASSGKGNPISPRIRRRKMPK